MSEKERERERGKERGRERGRERERSKWVLICIFCDSDERNKNKEI